MNAEFKEIKRGKAIENSYRIFFFCLHLGFQDHLDGHGLLLTQAHNAPFFLGVLLDQKTQVHLRVLSHLPVQDSGQRSQDCLDFLEDLEYKSVQTFTNVIITVQQVNLLGPCKGQIIIL